MLDRDEIYKKFKEKYWFFDCSLDIGDGWIPLVEQCFDEILEIVGEKEDEDAYIPFRTMQIKEKFGGLRIYLSSYRPEIENIVDKYEMKSFEICEECGKKGDTKSVGGWFVTLCDLHYEKRLEWNESY